MNESSITIRWEKNPDGSTDISVSGDKDYTPHFQEAFLSLDRLPSLHDITERETSGEECWKFGYNSTPYSAYSDYPKER